MKVTTDACLFGAWVANEVKNQKSKVKTVLDIGAGTGLLSLMCSQKNPSAVIDAIEVDEEACEQAKENVSVSPFADRVNLINADARTFSFTKKYPVIISNPPFYETEIISDDPKKNVAHHHSGLLLKELFNIITANLSPAGFFYLLLPFKRNEEIREIIFKQDLLLAKTVFVKQSPNHKYFRFMIQGKLQTDEPLQTTIDEISIWNDQEEYTDEFNAMLSDYYLVK